jgi:hypothetical protein
MATRRPSLADLRTQVLGGVGSDPVTAALIAHGADPATAATTHDHAATGTVEGTHVDSTDATNVAAGGGETSDGGGGADRTGHTGRIRQDPERRSTHSDDTAAPAEPTSAAASRDVIPRTNLAAVAAAAATARATHHTEHAARQHETPVRASGTDRIKVGYHLSSELSARLNRWKVTEQRRTGRRHTNDDIGEALINALPADSELVSQLVTSHADQLRNTDAQGRTGKRLVANLPLDMINRVEDLVIDIEAGHGLVVTRTALWSLGAHIHLGDITVDP